MMRIYVEGVGLYGPGLDGWAASVPVLVGAQEYVPGPIRVPQSALLPPNERRRAVQSIKIALAAGADAFAAAGRDPAETATVFASSGGDGETIHEILNVLASPNRELSPTRFHNSVHNTPAGYWSIATASRAASSSLSCYDDSFAAGLLEAAVQTITEQHAVGLVAYDVPYPAPLSDVRPIGPALATALVLTSESTDFAIAGIELDLRPKADASRVAPPALEVLRQSTPAARSLPLLAALARRDETTVMLDYLDDLALEMKVMPIQGSGAPDRANSERRPG